MAFTRIDDYSIFRRDKLLDMDVEASDYNVERDGIWVMTSDRRIVFCSNERIKYWRYNRTWYDFIAAYEVATRDGQCGNPEYHLGEDFMRTAIEGGHPYKNANKMRTMQPLSKQRLHASRCYTLVWRLAPKHFPKVPGAGIRPGERITRRIEERMNVPFEIWITALEDAKFQYNLLVDPERDDLLQVHFHEKFE